MPYLLLLLSLVFVSCGKKENALSHDDFTSPLEQRLFNIVKYNNENIIIRNKILNSFVEEKIPTTDSTNSILSHDELLDSDFNPAILKNYEAREETMSKIVVSFSDHTEIYFLPAYVTLASIPEKLDLKPEEGRVFKWLKNDSVKTYIKGVFYLASVNTEDIVLNDTKFYSEVIDLKKDFLNKSVKLSQGQTITLNVKYSTLLQGQTAQSFEGSTHPCTRDMRESDMCYACTYQRLVPAGNYSATSNVSMAALNFRLNVSGKSYSLAELNTKEISNTNFEIDLKSLDFDGRSVVTITVDSISTTSIGMTANGYNYSDRCIGRNENTTITLQRSIEASIDVKLFGRGEAALKNIL
jgi:hypothetical protein